MEIKKIYTGKIRLLGWLNPWRGGFRGGWRAMYKFTLCIIQVP
jgi:hypothetical protein